jgi:hypothetical protein
MPATDLNTRNQSFLRLFKTLALFLSLITVAGLITPRAAQVQAVPAVPNESLVLAEVIEASVLDSLTLNIRPRQVLYRLRLRVLTVEAVEGMENFLYGTEGTTIEVYLKEMGCATALVGKAIKARIMFRGDEGGGRYWIIGSVEVVTL